MSMEATQTGRGHLCLSREEGQVLNLHLPGGEVVRIEVYAVGQRRAWFRIEAPHSVKIMRSEIDTGNR